MLELLFLLLPVAAAYGWFMGRNSVRTEQRKEQEQFSKNYVAGINLLLSEESDKAVDLFIEMLDVDSDTIETHWTLGKLFRRRGEVERAIRIHQNLISRPSLSESDRHHAMYELGRDYLAAGLYDRAEKMLSELQRHSSYGVESQRALLALYEATNEWDKAIKVALRISRNDKSILPVVAQLYCELADLQDDFSHTFKFYEKALKHDKSCVRARLACGRWWLGQKSYTKALHYLYPIAESETDFLSEALPLIRECYLGKKDKEGFVTYLHEIVANKPCATAVIMLAEIIAHQNSTADAEQFLRTALSSNPTMKGFHKLIDLHISDADEGKARESLVLLKRMVKEQMKQRSTYRCRHCGFSSQTLFWHCPSCKSWSTIKPTRGLDGE